MGPDLAGVTARRDRVWLKRYILAPDKLLSEGDPIAVALFEKYQYARMPNLRLSSEEVAAVLSYVEGRGAARGR
jgi:protein SCO1/2